NITRADVQDVYQTHYQTGFAVPIEITSSPNDTGDSVFVYAFNYNMNRFELIDTQWYEFE
ncbi:MAG: hypothetical protein ABH846_03235, partial [Patescibacteria group bacterium]